MSWRAIAASATLLAAGCATGARSPAAGDWREILRASAAVHWIDLSSVRPLGPSTYRVVHRVTMEPFTNPNGVTFDRTESVVDYDCAGLRQRSISHRIYMGDRLLHSARLSGTWTNTSGPQQAVVKGACLRLHD